MRALEAARAKGHRLVVLVGDEVLLRQMRLQARSAGPRDHARPGRPGAPPRRRTHPRRLRRRLRPDPAGVGNGVAFLSPSRLHQRAGQKLTRSPLRRPRLRRRRTHEQLPRLPLIIARHLVDAAREADTGIAAAGSLPAAAFQGTSTPEPEQIAVRAFERGLLGIEPRHIAFGYPLFGRCFAQNNIHRSRDAWAPEFLLHHVKVSSLRGAQRRRLYVPFLARGDSPSMRLRGLPG